MNMYSYYFNFALIVPSLISVGAELAARGAFGLACRLCTAKNRQASVV